ncbi:MAG: DUF2784 domain-containing protein [Betaproteobacteria bacterium]|nr:DUF2784 domain-containing protein [Betaproteobacteria bacterium]
MLARIAADVVVIVHLLFVAFAVLGALFVLRRGWMAWVHLPAALWAAWIEWSGGICPLTDLENRLRAAAGQSGLGGGFVEYYLVPVLYPEGLTRDTQCLLAAVVIAVNGLLYAWIYLKRRNAAGVSR